MSPSEGLPGLDVSIPFSPAPLSHLFIVIHGEGDPYIDHQPWLFPMETSLSSLSQNYNLISDYFTRSTRLTDASPAPSAMFLPVEWHRPAFETWQAAVRQAEPRQFPHRTMSVRDTLTESIGDVLLMASPFWRESIARHIATQMESQIGLVKRNRPAFTGRISILAHSIGALLAVELVNRQLLSHLQLDSVILLGSPIAAYSALAPDGGHQTALAAIRRLRTSIRFFNIYHPLDPVAYRLEPYVLSEMETLQEPVRVTPTNRTFWDDATRFWDDVVYKVWKTLFPSRSTDQSKSGKVGSATAAASMGGLPDLFALLSRGRQQLVGGRERENTGNGHSDPCPAASERMSARGTGGGMQRSSSYVMTEVAAETDEGQASERSFEKEKGGNYVEEGDGSRTGGSEVALSGRIDYELQDGMGVPPLDVMASWGTIKAHSYYWQSLDVAQILFDIATTSDEFISIP